MAITDKIVSAVTKAIYKEFSADFGDDMIISKGNIEQGFKANAFTVRCINPDIEQDLYNLYHTNFTLSICFFPDENKSQTEINSTFYDVIERLNSIFEILKVNDELSILGKNIDKTISDENVLIYVISFNTRMVKEVEEVEKMKELTIMQEVR